MANIPHVEGRYPSRKTAYGVKKATATEAARRFVEAHNLGWITAVADCAIYLLNEKETCFLKVRTSKSSICLHLSVKLTPRREKHVFPISFAEVMVGYDPIDGIEGEGWQRLLYGITEDGDMFLTK